MPGWFVTNVRDANWRTCEGFGAAAAFDTREDRFEQVGINVRVLEPGDKASMYHGESVQEDFLVLSGTCTLVIEGEERQLHAWDFVHSPPGTEHVFVGAGDGPCIIVMVGARRQGIAYHYPVCEAAQRLGAGVEQETDSPDEAYAGTPPLVEGRPERWDDLPWAGRN